MREVKPISDENIEDIAQYLKSKNERDYVMFMFMLHTGLRISDVLKLRISDVVNKKTIYMQEQKTGKWKEIELSSKLKKILKEYCEGKEPNEYLIKSRKGYNNPLQRDRAYKIIRNAAEKHGLKRIGCHSTRKTFGRKYYKKYGDTEELRRYFNHSNSGITLRYIGLEQEVINKHVKGLWD